MPATAIRRRRGQSGVLLGVHASTGMRDQPRRAKRRKSQAQELEIQRVLVTTSRLQRLARGIFPSGTEDRKVVENVGIAGG